MKSDTLIVYKLGGIPVTWFGRPALVSIQYTEKSEQSGIILLSLTAKYTKQNYTNYTVRLMFIMSPICPPGIKKISLLLENKFVLPIFF